MDDGYLEIIPNRAPRQPLIWNDLTHETFMRIRCTTLDENSFSEEMCNEMAKASKEADGIICSTSEKDGE